MRLSALHLEGHAYSAEARAVIEEVCDVNYMGSTSTVQVSESLLSSKYEVLFVGLDRMIDAALMSCAPALKVIVSPTTGLDHIDQAAARQRGVTVLSLRDIPEKLVETSSTAELAWGLLLAVARGIPSVHGKTLGGSWQRPAEPGRDLRGLTLGVVGVGRLGSFVATYGHAFGMTVLGHDLRPRPTVDHVCWVQAEELLSTSDVVSLHLPLNATTQGWLSRDRIRHMKQGAILVNTARASLIDERALSTALREGWLYGYGTDVLEGETHHAGIGQPIRSPLLDAANDGLNVVLTPHIGGWATQAVAHTRLNMASFFASYVQTHFSASDSRPVFRRHDR